MEICDTSELTVSRLAGGDVSLVAVAMVTAPPPIAAVELVVAFSVVFGVASFAVIFGIVAFILVVVVEYAVVFVAIAFAVEFGTVVAFVESIVDEFVVAPFEVVTVSAVPFAVFITKIGWLEVDD